MGPWRLAWSGYSTSWMVSFYFCNWKPDAATVMTLTALIASYGYYALFVGTFLEGETVLIAAGFAAHRGILDLS